MGEKRFRTFTINSDIAWDLRLTTTTTVFLSQLLLPSLLFCYGPWFQQRVSSYGLSAGECLLAPFMFYFFWCIGNPISRYICEIIETSDKNYFKWMVYTGISLTSGGIFLASFSSSQIYFNIGYGLTAGFGTSLYLTYINYFVYEEFQSKPAIFNSLIQAGRALGLFTIPFILQFLLRWQGTGNTLFILSAILLHTIPILLLSNINRANDIFMQNSRNSLNQLTRYQSTSRMVFNNELNEYNIQQRIYANEPFQNSLSTFTTNRNWKSPSDVDNDEISSLSSVVIEDEQEENQTEKGDINEYNILDDDDPSKIYEMHSRFKNALGVDILPGIPEEAEESSSSEEEILTRSNSKSRTRRISLKRLSTISTKLEELALKEARCPDERRKSSETKHQDIVLSVIDPITEGDVCSDVQSNSRPRSFLQEIGKTESKCNCCVPYRRYLLKRRFRVTGKRFLKFFVSPLASACKIIEFYPCLLSRAIESVSSIIIFSTLPHVASNAREGVSLEASTFPLSLASFSWLFITMLATPWVQRFTKSKMKILYVFGILLAGFTSFQLTRARYYNLIALYSLVYGFAYGLISISSDVIFKEALGVRNYPKTEAAFEILSGILTLCFFYVIFVLVNDVMKWYLIICIFYFIIGAIWILSPLVKFIYLYEYRKVVNPPPILE